MERLRKELVGGWEIKAWLHRYTKHEGSHHSLDSGQRRQSGTGPMICSYFQGLAVMLPCLVAFRLESEL